MSCETSFQLASFSSSHTGTNHQTKCGYQDSQELRAGTTHGGEPNRKTGVSGVPCRARSTLPAVPVTKCPRTARRERRNAQECELSRDWL
ncbi:hypothetical protein MTO96_013382 [Rhipicephalus appendiculatus]